MNILCYICMYTTSAEEDHEMQLKAQEKAGKWTIEPFFSPCQTKITYAMSIFFTQMGWDQPSKRQVKIWIFMVTKLRKKIQHTYNKTQDWL